MEWPPWQWILVAGVRSHAGGYRSAEDFAGQRVAVVGGDSGAPIAADPACRTEPTWVTTRSPRYLPDDIDGRALFDAPAVARCPLSPAAARRPSPVARRPPLAAGRGPRGHRGSGPAR